MIGAGLVHQLQSDVVDCNARWLALPSARNNSIFELTTIIIRRRTLHQTDLLAPPSPSSLDPLPDPRGDPADPFECDTASSPDGDPVVV